MKKLVVMLGSSDAKNVYVGHPGDSDIFIIYEIFENGEWNEIRQVKNEVKDVDEGEHGSKGKMKKVLELIGDVDVILSRRNSPNLIRMASQTLIQPVIVRGVESIEEALRKLMEHFNDVHELHERRLKGERPEILII